MILFLDFDGVLHRWPCPPQDAFAAAPRLLAVLDDFPAVDVVVSSSWRTMQHTRAWQQIPEALRARIVGHTPEIRRREHGQPVAGLPPIRYAEVLRYLAESGQPDRDWIALDDDVRLFPANCPNLILCLDGFGKREADKLHARLQVACRPRGPGHNHWGEMQRKIEDAINPGADPLIRKITRSLFPT